MMDVSNYERVLRKSNLVVGLYRGYKRITVLYQKALLFYVFVAVPHWSDVLHLVRWLKRILTNHFNSECKSSSDMLPGAIIRHRFKLIPNKIVFTTCE